MALNATTLSAELKANLLASGIANENDGQLQITCDAIASAIVTRLLADLEVKLPAASFNVNGQGATPNPETSCSII